MKIDDKTQRVLKSVRLTMDRTCKVVAKGSVRHMKKLLARKYPPPSIPGEAPHRRSGDLRESVYADRVEYWSEHSTWNVGASSEYARYLEYGTSGMAARPFVRPTMYEYAMLAMVNELEKQFRWR